VSSGVEALVVVVAVAMVTSALSVWVAMLMAMLASDVSVWVAMIPVTVA